jgi:sporulation-control protein spo0M
MGLSENLREALGAEGVQLEVLLDAATVSAGGSLEGTIVARGGTREARLAALVLRVARADRQWTDLGGSPVAEADAVARVDRSGLVARWNRQVVAQDRVVVDVPLAPRGEHRVPFRIEIPSATPATTLACTYTLAVQADVPGQIDPTTNAHVRVG